jgi:hypothetical protein
MTTIIQDPDVPVGSVVLCRWAFTVVTLTLAETATLTNDDVLPTNAVVVVPNLVLYDFTTPGAGSLTISGAGASLDGIMLVAETTAGIYNAELPIRNAGVYVWRGYGQDGIGNPVGAMFPHQFTAG